MSDLFGNHIVGFPTRRLIYEQCQTVHRMQPKRVKSLNSVIFDTCLENKYKCGLAFVHLSKIKSKLKLLKSRLAPQQRYPTPINS